jgi:hypothetical protein
LLAGRREAEAHGSPPWNTPGPMSVESINASGVFRVGPVLRQAWRLLTGNIAFFLGVPVLMYVAVVLAVAAATFRVPGQFRDYGPGAVEVSLYILLAFGLDLVGQALLLIGAFQRLNGQPLRVGQALHRTLARLSPLLGLVVLTGLALAVCLILSFYAALVFFSMLRLGRGTMLLSAVALLPFMAPAAILLVTWIAIVPACVVEGLSPLASIIRSTGLTKGYRLRIFAVVLLLGLLLLVVPIVQAVLAPVVQGLATIVATICLLVWIAYWNCAIIMTYHDLRVAKEGIDTGQIAAIFD